MEDKSGKERPILRLTYDKVEELLFNIARHPRLLPCEHALRRLRDHLLGVVEPPPTDVEMHTTVLDGMCALIDEASEMPSDIKWCVAMAVLSYLSEQLVHFHSLKSSRPLTESEERFCKDRLLGLLHQLAAIIKPHADEEKFPGTVD